MRTGLRQVGLRGLGLKQGVRTPESHRCCRVRGRRGQAGLLPAGLSQPQTKPASARLDPAPTHPPGAACPVALLLWHPQRTAEHGSEPPRSQYWTTGGVFKCSWEMCVGGGAGVVVPRAKLPLVAPAAHFASDPAPCIHAPEGNSDEPSVWAHPWGRPG